MLQSWQRASEGGDDKSLLTEEAAQPWRENPGCYAACKLPVSSSHSSVLLYAKMTFFLNIKNTCVLTSFFHRTLWINRTTYRATHLKLHHPVKGERIVTPYLFFPHKSLHLLIEKVFSLNIFSLPCEEPRHSNQYWWGKYSFESCLIADECLDTFTKFLWQRYGSVCNYLLLRLFFLI